MKLVSIRGNFFRGFRDSPSISLDSSLVIFFGPNGSGKTSIAEALEWLFYGTTRRKLRSDVDEVEHRGALRMVDCPVGVNPFVEADVRFRDGNVHKLKRTLYVDGTNEWTVASIDDLDVPDFASIGLGDSEYFYPIIIQDNLQERIRSTGATRRRYISSLLGLEPLIGFDRAIDTACNRFMASLPQRLAQYYESFRETRENIIRWGMLSALSQRWDDERVAFPSDWNEILEFCRSELEMTAAEPDEIMAQAIHQADLARKAIFDISPYAPKQNLEKLLDVFDEAIQGVCISLEHLQQVLIDYINIKTQIYSQLHISLDPKRLDFYRMGYDYLGIPTDGDDKVLQCPFCDEMTITQEKIDLLQSRFDHTKQYSQIRDHLIEIIATCHDKVEDLINHGRSLLPDQLDTDVQDLLLLLLPKAPTEIGLLYESIQITQTSFIELERHSQEINANLQNIISLILYRTLTTGSKG